jgi:hypothetical protein
MTPSYQRLKKWFKENYGHLGYDLPTFYIIDSDLICRFDILRFGRETKIKNLNLGKIMDFTANDSDLRKLLFDALFRQYGYNVGNDFIPLKQIKEFKL